MRSDQQELDKQQEWKFLDKEREEYLDKFRNIFKKQEFLKAHKSFWENKLRDVMNDFHATIKNIQEVYSEFQKGLFKIKTFLNVLYKVSKELEDIDRVYFQSYIPLLKSIVIQRIHHT